MQLIACYNLPRTTNDSMAFKLNGDSIAKSILVGAVRSLSARLTNGLTFCSHCHVTGQTHMQSHAVGRLGGGGKSRAFSSHASYHARYRNSQIATVRSHREMNGRSVGGNRGTARKRAEGQTKLNVDVFVG